jgi:hypothetical protein
MKFDPVVAAGIGLWPLAIGGIGFASYAYLNHPSTNVPDKISSTAQTEAVAPKSTAFQREPSSPTGEVAQARAD